MPQRDQLFEWKSIWDNVTLGLAVQRERGDAAYDHVRELLDRYELSGFGGKAALPAVRRHGGSAVR